MFLGSGLDFGAFTRNSENPSPIRVTGLGRCLHAEFKNVCSISYARRVVHACTCMLGAAHRPQSYALWRNACVYWVWLRFLYMHVHAVYEMHVSGAVIAEFRIQAFLHVGRNLHVHAMVRCGFCSHKLFPLQGRHFLRLRPCHGLVWQAGSCRLIELHDGLYVPYDVSSMYWTPLDPNVAAEPPITCFFVVRRCAACARHHARLTKHRRRYMRRVRRHTRVSN